MPREHGMPADWLGYAYSDLDIARQEPPTPRVRRETLCFHAQQAAEKAIKAVLLAQRVEVPRTHNLGVLLELVPKAVPVPVEVSRAGELSDYAVVLRYPGESEAVTPAEHQRAVELAAQVVLWAEQVLQQ